MPCTIQFCTVQFSFALLYSLQVKISLGGVGIDVVDSDDGDVGDDNDDDNGERVRISVGLKGKTSLISIFIKSSLSPRLYVSTSLLLVSNACGKYTYIRYQEHPIKFK